VPRPSFAIARRSEQLVHHLHKCIGRRVADEACTFFGRGDQAGQIGACPADQRDPVRGRHRSDSLLFELRQDERVDIVLHPRAILRLWNRGFGNFLKRPPPALLSGELFRRIRGDQ